MTCLPSPPDLSQPVSLFHGDCVDVVAGLPDGCVDLVVTDPPYLIETGGTTGDSKIARDSRAVFAQYEGFSHGFDMSLLDGLLRVSRTVNWYFFCSKRQIPDYIRWAESHGVNWDLLFWWKTNAIPLTHGSKRLPDVEYVMFLFKNAPVRGGYQDVGHVYASVTNRRDKELYHHPTCKPVPLLQRYIRVSSGEGGVVLDPFMGSGSTGVAAATLGRRFIGVELDEGFYETACNRIRDCSMSGVMSGCQATLF